MPVRSQISSRVFILLSMSTLTSLLLGCSFMRKQDDCPSDQACAESFGPGYQCGSDGLCHPAELHPSCLTQYPADLLQAPEKYKGYTLIGSLLRENGKEGARHNAALLAFEAVNQHLEEQQSEADSLRFGFIQCNHEGDRDEIASLGSYLANDLSAAAIIGPASSSATQERRVSA